MKVVALSSEPSSSAAVTGDSETVTATLDMKGGSGSTSADIVIAFVWDYDDSSTVGKNDVNDTEYGENAASGSADLSIGTLKITADQVD